MEKWYDVFRIPQDGKICEKTMLARVTVTVIVIVACLAAITVTAYAHFSANVTAPSNTIVASGFRANVAICMTDANGTPVQVTSEDGKTHTANLLKDTVYFVTLTPHAENSAKTGYVVLTAADCADRYHTQQIGLDAGALTDSVSFYIRPTADTTVELLPHWGTSSYYQIYRAEGDTQRLYITTGETVVLDVQSTSVTTTATTTATTTDAVTTATTTTTATETSVATTVTTVTEAQTSAQTTTTTVVTELEEPAE